MKIEFEQEDIRAIAVAVTEMLKPIINRHGKSEVEDSIFTPKTLATYLQVDTPWVYKQVSLKAIPYFKNGKYIRFKKSAIDRWIESQTVKSISPFRLIKNNK